jgi:hypothetical protein
MILLWVKEGLEHADNKQALHPASTHEMFLIEK